MIKYKISFNNHVEYLSEEGLQNFINIAVIKNKDISSFTVETLTTENYAQELNNTFLFKHNDRFSILCDNLYESSNKFIIEVLYKLKNNNLVLDEIISKAK